MADFLKDMIAKSKANAEESQKNQINPQIINKQPEETKKETPKFNFNFKNSNTKTNNSLSANGKDAQTDSIKTPKFSFVKAPSSPANEKESVSVSAEKSASPSPKADPATTSPPDTDDSIGEIDVSDFVFKDQPEKFSQEAVDKLNGAISILKDSIDNKQAVGQAIQIIMKTLQQHEFLKDIMRAHPEHLGLMVRGLRESYGSVIVKKGTNKAKRKAKDDEVDKISDMLAGFGA